MEDPPTMEDPLDPTSFGAEMSFDDLLDAIGLVGTQTALTAALHKSVQTDSEAAAAVLALQAHFGADTDNAITLNVGPMVTKAGRAQGHRMVTLTSDSAALASKVLGVSAGHVTVPEPPVKSSASKSPSSAAVETAPPAFPGLFPHVLRFFAARMGLKMITIKVEGRDSHRTSGAVLQVMFVAAANNPSGILLGGAHAEVLRQHGGHLPRTLIQWCRCGRHPQGAHQPG